MFNKDYYIMKIYKKQALFC